jgi:hypothetical protein
MQIDGTRLSRLNSVFRPKSESTLYRQGTGLLSDWARMAGRQFGNETSSPLLDDAELHIHIVASSIRVGARLVRFGDERLGLGSVDAGQGNLQRDLEAETALGARPDTYSRGHGGVRWDLRPALRSNELHCADEAGCIAGGEELFGIRTGSTRAAEFLRLAELDVEGPVEGSGMPVTAACGACGSAIENVHGH